MLSWLRRAILVDFQLRDSVSSSASRDSSSRRCLSLRSRNALCAARFCARLLVSEMANASTEGSESLKPGVSPCGARVSSSDGEVLMAPSKLVLEESSCLRLVPFSEARPPWPLVGGAWAGAEECESPWPCMLCTLAIGLSLSTLPTVPRILRSQSSWNLPGTGR